MSITMRSAPPIFVLVAFAALWLWSPGVRQTVPTAQTTAARDLDAAEQRWKASRPYVYEFTIEVRCLGGMDTPPPRYRVVGDTPTVLSPVLSRRGTLVYEHGNTVEKLFLAIRSVVERGAYRAAVSYDERLGYPLVADLDPDRFTIDEEVYFAVTDFRAR